MGDVVSIGYMQVKWNVVVNSFSMDFAINRGGVGA